MEVQIRLKYLNITESVEGTRGVCSRLLQNILKLTWLSVHCATNASESEIMNPDISNTSAMWHNSQTHIGDSSEKDLNTKYTAYR